MFVAGRGTSSRSLGRRQHSCRFGIWQIRKEKVFRVQNVGKCMGTSAPFDGKVSKFLTVSRYEACIPHLFRSPKNLNTGSQEEIARSLRNERVLVHSLDQQPKVVEVILRSIALFQHEYEFLSPKKEGCKLPHYDARGSHTSRVRFRPANR